MRPINSLRNKTLRCFDLNIIYGLWYLYIQTDAYAGYNQLFKEGERVSDARRKFTDVLKSLSKKRKIHMLRALSK